MRKPFAALALAFLLSLSVPAKAATYDVGIQYTSAPRTEEFVRRLREDSIVPWCTFSMSIDRICRVANNPKLRKVVWQRILRESIFTLARKQQKRIEVVAADCDMPLTDR